MTGDAPQSGFTRSGNLEEPSHRATPVSFGKDEMAAIDHRIQTNLLALEADLRPRYRLGTRRHPSSDFILNVGSAYQFDLVYFVASKGESMDTWLGELQERGQSWTLNEFLAELSILVGAAILDVREAGEPVREITREIRRQLAEKNLLSDHRLNIIYMGLPGVIKQPCSGCVFLVGYESLPSAAPTH